MFNEFDIDALHAVCDYLNDDHEMHLASSGKWRLDRGKLQAALDHAGIVGLEHSKLVSDEERDP